MAENFKITDPAAQTVTAGALPHPGAWLRHNVIEARGLKVADAARRIGSNRVSLANLLDGRAALTRDMAYRLEALSGVSADLMIGLQLAYDISQERELRARYGREIERVETVAE